MSKFEIYESRNGQYYWRLKAGNGETVATSEGYTTKSHARRSIDSVRSIAAGADIIEL